MLRPIAIATAIACGLLFAARAANAGWPTDPSVNLPVCTATGEQTSPLLLTDGQGGAYVLWRDRRSGSVFEVYGQHAAADGTLLWAADGVRLKGLGTTVDEVLAVPDGVRGFFIACRSGSAASFDHVPFDPTRPNQPGQRTAVLSATALLMALGVSGGGEVIAAWIEDHGTVDSLRVDRWRRDPDDDRHWLRVSRAASTAPSGAVRMRVADDGAGGAWLVIASMGSGERFDVDVLRAAGSVVSQVRDLLWTGSGQDIADYTEELFPCPDGGAFVVWDGSTGSGIHPSFDTNDVIALRLDSDGNEVALTVVGDAGPSLIRPRSCPDGAGGLVVTWIDDGTRQVRARHVNSTGMAAWPLEGMLVSGTTMVTPLNPHRVAATTDGGIFALWPSTGLRASRLGPDGWPEWSAPVLVGTGNTNAFAVAGDATGGGFAAWKDTRTDASGDITMQCLRGHGVLNGAATIASVADVPADQGGRVRITWAASPLDAGGDVEAYGVWRWLDEGAAAAAMAAGARILTVAPLAADARPGVLRVTYAAASAAYWEGVGMVPARGQSTYSLVAATLADSGAGGAPWEVFMVDAHERDHPLIWDSAPDSGYSVDNLAPPAPAALAGEYASGTTSLHWSPIPAHDLALYRVYAGGTLDFTVDGAHRIAETPDTTCIHAPGGPRFYKVTGVDVNGNEGAAATFDPGVPVAVDGPLLPAALWLGPPEPNPARGSFRIRFELPEAAHVETALHDVSGRRIRVITSEWLRAGVHARAWDGFDAHGRAPGPGLYVLSLRAGGRVVCRKVMLLR